MSVMTKLEKAGFADNFKAAYKDLYGLHPVQDNKEFRFRYLKVDWFFPNHIYNVLDNINLFADKYFKGVDIQAAMFGGLFHDAGLVFNRDSADPSGHEKRSIEYANIELLRFGYSQDFIEKVNECIRATEPSYKTTLSEGLLVRNADAHAHIMSMHFFAKANFTEDIHDYIKWFDKKLELTFSKLTVEDLIKSSQPILESYRSMIDNYKNNKDRDFLSEIK